MQLNLKFHAANNAHVADVLN